VDAAQALADLTEISSQIEAAVLFDESGTVLASTLPDEARARELARAAAELLEAADGVQAGGGSLTQLDAATLDGSVFVVRDGDRRIAATTAPEPTVGLVFYDLKSCLRNVEAEPPKPAPKPRRPRKKKPADDAA
jgi:predicted regulator of Ras-like GTPase activity (Roadblock/LC7/MglB family)